MGQFNNELSYEVYRTTYRFGEEKELEETQLRVAENISSVEENKEYWKEKFMDILKDFKFVPGGRILSNAGTKLKGTTLINCFVDGFAGEDKDSMEGIMNALRRQAMILKSEGGYGFCADVMRPRGGYIEGIANESPGAVEMLSMWNTQSSVITAGSGKKVDTKKSKEKIRKGAQMVTMSCWHPDIEEFVTAKQTPGRLDKFNMSVLITNEFMEAVEKNEKWDMIFPDFEFDKNFYEKEWDGNIKRWISIGGKTKVYKSYDNANELWDLIMNSTYNRNEPGVIFIDIVNYLNNLYYVEYISSSNPCGEQFLPIGGVCLLGSLNLTQFINKERTNWDYNKLKDVIPIAVRFMDNVNDITYVPLEEQKQNLIQKRRIGLGIMGYGSALMMMKKRYGSEDSLKITDELMNFISNTAYQSSAFLAKEKGSFLLYDEKKYLNGNFIKGLSVETQDIIKKNGIRNSHLLSVQPTGNSSILSNNVSGGLEPIFMFEYIRTVIQPYPPDGLILPKNIDFENRTCEENSQNWEWIKEGDDNLMRKIFNGVIYKIDKGRGLLKENEVVDYGVKFLEELEEWDPKSDYAVNIGNLKIEDHINTMKVISKYIDSAMSKTINITNDYPYEDFKRVYKDLYHSKTIKGCTTYRAGTMATVLKDKKEDKKIENPYNDNAPKRPKNLHCDVVRFTNKGDKWIGFVGLLKTSDDDPRPYEIFTGLQDSFPVPNYVENGDILKSKIDGISRYDFIYKDKDGYPVIMTGLNRAFDRELWNYGKMISGVLRHRMPIKNVVDLIDSLKFTEDNIVTWKAGVKRMLKKYLKAEASSDRCPNCGSTNYVHEAGCDICKDCSFSSKCS